MSDIIDIASKEVGYKAYGGNKTKYSAWYGMNGAAWCHMFASWCANQADISTDVVPKTASTSTGMQWFKDRGRFKYKGSYTPKRNDFVYFKSDGASHVGIVEYVSGSTLHTIEGNTSDAVKKRTYPLSYHTITGYGVVSDYITSSGDNSKGKNAKNNKGKEELRYLKKILDKNEDKKKKSKRKVKYKVSKIRPGINLSVKVIVAHGTAKYKYQVQEGMKFSDERKGAPGKLTFTTFADNKRKITNGDAVAVIVNKRKFFYGFIFSFSPKTDGTLEVTAYDQLRYFKNKDTYISVNKTSTALLKKIAKDFNLKCGKLANTKYPVSRIDDNATLFDIVQNSLDETLIARGKIYTLYDDYGNLRLREPWKVNVLMSGQTAESYDYKESIEDQVYNQIKLAYDNSKKGTQEVFVVKNSKSINQWGVLQYYDKVDSKKDIKLKLKSLLDIYCKSGKTLKFNNCFGDARVRAGCLVPVTIKIYDQKVSGYLLVDKVTHTFNNSQHLMDLELSGGDFDSSY